MATNMMPDPGNRAKVVLLSDANSRNGDLRRDRRISRNGSGVSSSSSSKERAK